MNGVARMVPDLLIVGVHKAGTSTLADMLARHPGVDFASVKEPGFLHLHDNPGLRRLAHGDSVMEHERMADPSVYGGLFGVAPDQPSSRLRAEASTVSFESARTRAAVAAARAADRRVRVVVSLRDPVRRAHSAWAWMRKAGLEPLEDFAAALAAEEARRAEGWWIDYHYRARGFYADPLAAWRDVAGADCHVVVLESLLAEARPGQALHAALGLDPALAAPMAHANPSGLHRTPLRRALARLSDRHDFRERAWKRAMPEGMRRALGRVRTAFKDRLDRGLVPPPSLEPGLADSLRSGYAAEVDRLSQQLDMDLATLWWDAQPVESSSE